MQMLGGLLALLTLLSGAAGIATSARFDPAASTAATTAPWPS